jgi:hypothetical protein
MTCLHNRLHASHFPGVEPDLDAVRVVSRCCEDISHDSASQPFVALI